MKEIRYRGNSLLMHDSIEEVAITKVMDFNRMVMVEEGIGSDLEATANRINTIRAFNAKGDKKNVDQELKNLQQNIFFIVNNVSPKMNAFVSLIETMNGKPLKKNYDPVEVIEELSKQGLTMGKVNGFMDHVKKKLRLKLSYFSQKWQTILRRKSVMPS